MAKELIRVRGQIGKLQSTKTTLQCVSNRATTAGATAAMTGAIGGATRAMAAANAQMNPAQMQQIMMQYEKQSQQMEIADEYDSLSLFLAFPLCQCLSVSQ